MMHIENKNLHNLEFHLILWLLKQAVILELKEKIDFLLTCPIYRKNINECSINFAWPNITLFINFMST